MKKNDILLKNLTPAVSNKTYDNLKRIAQYVLPAIGTLYFTLSQIWGLPNGEEVVGTIVALEVFLGVALGYSSKSYRSSEARFDGSLVVDQGKEDKDIYRFEVESPLEELKDKSELVIRVRKP